MSLADLFKSTAEIKKEKRREITRARRDLERSMETVSEHIANLQKKRDDAWAKARDSLRDGQKATAQRYLQTVQANEVMMGKLERRNWMVEQYSMKLDIAQSDISLSESLAKLSKLIVVDPDKLTEALSDVTEILSDQGDIDKIWAKEYAKETNGLAQSDAVPSLDEMMSSLEKQVAADVSNGKNIAGKVASKIDETIGAGRQRLQDLINGKK